MAGKEGRIISGFLSWLLLVMDKYPNEKMEATHIYLISEPFLSLNA